MFRNEKEFIVDLSLLIAYDAAVLSLNAVLFVDEYVDRFGGWLFDVAVRLRRKGQKRRAERKLLSLAEFGKLVSDINESGAYKPENGSNAGGGGAGSPTRTD